MEAYCEFYEVAPGADALRSLARALREAPDGVDGEQLLARDPATGAPVGFATLYWTWSSTSAQRIGVMNDLFVAPSARGTGLGAALIEACAERCRAYGVTLLEWQTALDNTRAQKTYDRTGATRTTWHTYGLEL